MLFSFKERQQNKAISVCKWIGRQDSQRHENRPASIPSCGWSGGGWRPMIQSVASFQISRSFQGCDPTPRDTEACGTRLGYASGGHFCWAAIGPFGLL